MDERLEPTVRDYEPGDLDAAIGVLAESFIDFPPVAMLVGTGAEARRRSREMFELLLGGDLVFDGLVGELDGRIVGVLTYADLPDCDATSPSLMLRMLRLAGLRIVRALPMIIRLSRAHPSTPHRHLPFLGVDPAVQGRGVGERLMAEYAGRCDAAGLDGYLETVRWADASKPSHARFYGRHGFEVADVIPVEDAWSLISMVRPVR